MNQAIVFKLNYGSPPEDFLAYDVCVFCCVYTLADADIK